MPNKMIDTAYGLLRTLSRSLGGANQGAGPGSRGKFGAGKGGWDGIPEADRVLGEIAELEYDINNEDNKLKELKKELGPDLPAAELMRIPAYKRQNDKINNLKGLLNKRKRYLWDWYYRPSGQGPEGPKGAETRPPKGPGAGGPKEPTETEPDSESDWPMIGTKAVWGGPRLPPPLKRHPQRPPPEKLTDLPKTLPPSPGYSGAKTGFSTSRGWRVHPIPPHPPQYIRPGMSPAGALVMPRGSKTGLSPKPTDGGPPGPTIPTYGPAPGGHQGSKTGTKVRSNAGSGGGPPYAENVSRILKALRNIREAKREKRGGSKSGSGRGISNASPSAR